MSQPNPINLDVNEDNDDGTTATVSKSFERQETHNGRSVWTTNASTPLNREVLGLYASAPKPSGNILGTSKATVKTTRDCQVPGADGVANYTRPIIFETKSSIPAGADPVLVKAERMKQAALLMDDEVMDQLILNQRTS